MSEETKQEQEKEKPKEEVKQEEKKKTAPLNLYEALASLDGGENFIAVLKANETEAKKTKEKLEQTEREKAELERKYAIADEQNRSNKAKLEEARIHSGELMARIDRSYEGKMAEEKKKEELKNKLFGKW